MLPRVAYPRPPALPDDLPMSVALRDFMQRMVDFNHALVRALEDGGNRSVERVNAIDYVGSTIESGTEIKVSRRIHPVVGDRTISTIKADPSFSGQVTLICASGPWKLTAGDNVAADLAPAVGQAVTVTYNPATGKWYPHV